MLGERSRYLAPLLVFDVCGFGHGFGSLTWFTVGLLGCTRVFAVVGHGVIGIYTKVHNCLLAPLTAREPAAAPKLWIALKTISDQVEPYIERPHPRRPGIISRCRCAAVHLGYGTGRFGVS